MANDYIPGPDGGFHIWQNALVTYVNAHLGDLGLPAGDVAALSGARANWIPPTPAIPKPRTPPADPKELRFLAVDIRMLCTTDFDAVDACKTAHHMLHCISTTGEQRPWSATVGA